MHTDTQYNKVIEEWRVQTMLTYLYQHIETDNHENLRKTISSYQNWVASVVYDPKERLNSSHSKIFLDTNGTITIDNTNEKKLKGYQYDSLVYRYIRAREKQAEYEYIYGKTSDRTTCDKRANRDIMRFCEILDEVIGEHE